MLLTALVGMIRKLLEISNGSKLLAYVLEPHRIRFLDRIILGILTEDVGQTSDKILVRLHCMVLNLKVLLLEC